MQKCVIFRFLFFVVSVQNPEKLMKQWKTASVLLKMTELMYWLSELLPNSVSVDLLVGVSTNRFSSEG